MQVQDHHDRPAPPSRPETPMIYDLRGSGGSSDAFYLALASLADQTLSAIENRAAPPLDGYTLHIQTFAGEARRSRGEYALEFLTLGLILDRYEGAAQHTPHWAPGVARGLLWLRRYAQPARPFTDWLRAGLNRLALVHPSSQKPVRRGTATERLDRLVDWMEATGEFQHEAMRVRNWRSYLAGLKPEKATAWLHVAVDLFHVFARDAEAALGCYTRGVASFVAREQMQASWREDLFMREKPEVEYHLNMLAAEVMNRGLRESFVQTPNRVVLLPGCMRAERSHPCKARIDGVDITCAGCDPDCTVNRITGKLRAEGVKVYIVPHSSGFSRWLSRWQNAGAGVVAVACAPNILPGGLEIRERNIPSQCLLLDFPGCRRHWDPVGIPTAVNEPRLVQIAKLRA